MAFDFDSIARRLEKHQYAEAALRETKYSSVAVKDGKVDSAKEGGESSISFRVFANGAFGFAATNILENAVEALEKAAALARARPGSAKIAAPQANTAKTILKPKKNAAGMGIGEKIRLLKEYSGIAERKGIFSVSAGLTVAANRKIFANSVGTRIESAEPRIVCSIQAYAKDGARKESSYHQVKRRAGSEALSQMPKKAEQAGREAVMLLNAAHAPKGRMTAVLDPELAGVMAHEAVGHACEADEVQSGGSILSGMLGKRIGSGAVNIRDTPLLDKGIWGCYDYDDEGTKPTGSLLVKNGALNEYLTSLDTALECRNRLSGNARAENGHRPIVRMTNTFFDKGDASVKELFDGVKKGVYLAGCKEGQVSPKSGNFTFAAKYGYIVENGEKSALVKDCSINGNILTSLHGIDLVASDLDFSPGTCGKEGQGVPVTTGSPHLRIKGILVG
ncbi:MAG: TldD/PmbA family protein [Candidatus Micrarchaeota archaeon]